VNGSGMHTNVSVSKDKTNLFWDEKGEEQLSSFGWSFLDRILTHALDLCLIFNSSVNAYRRLDPHFEAPNQIRASATDRGAMVRVPIGNHRSMRTEVRAVAPDANPYLALYSIFKTGVDGEIATIDDLRAGGRYLPDNIYKAIDDFKESSWIAKILGGDVQGRYTDLKQAAADRSPRELGTFVKASEVQFHHEIYNQALWNLF
jgi:glutamine synthetase